MATEGMFCADNLDNLPLAHAWSRYRSLRTLPCVSSSPSMARAPFAPLYTFRLALGFTCCTPILQYSYGGSLNGDSTLTPHQQTAPRIPPPPVNCAHLGLDACDAASRSIYHRQLVHTHIHVPGSRVPLLVASSNSVTSTAAPGRCTYRTTLPLMKTFLTDD